MNYLRAACNKVITFEKQVKNKELSLSIPNTAKC